MASDSTAWHETFKELVDAKHAKKILAVAQREPPEPNTFPYYTKEGTFEYIYEPLEGWTSGFLPGSLWALCERADLGCDVGIGYDELEILARTWQEKLLPLQYNGDTHDVGFMIMPSFQRQYDKYHDIAAGEVIVRTAKSLMTRWNDKVQCFRSWNAVTTKAYEFDSIERDFLVIIDNMMNLDVLFSASVISDDPTFADHAIKHAETTLKHFIREDDSTFHLTVFDPVTGKRKIGLTAEGWRHESTWSQGQAWALYGYATVFKYTRNPVFLDVARKLADYFVSKLDAGIVYWDFDAPRPCVWDTAGAMIACSGMLLICQLENSKRYVAHVASIVSRCLKDSLTPDGPNSDVILCHGTVDNYEYAHNKLADCGLVYGDYYFIETGNRLIDMGLA
jgi:hypothetical protein